MNTTEGLTEEIALELGEHLPICNGDHRKPLGSSGCCCLNTPALKEGEYERGHESGFDEGYEAGREKGYDKGFARGYNEGYDNGYNDARYNLSTED